MSALTLETQKREGERINMIDCDAKPFVPEGWTIEEHQKGGKFEWNLANIELYFLNVERTEKRKEGVEDTKFRDELKGKPVLNANVLDFLLENQHLIPDEWKGINVAFWGTVYRNEQGCPDVRSLSWWDGRGQGIPEVIQSGSWSWGWIPTEMDDISKSYQPVAMRKDNKN